MKKIEIQIDLSDNIINYLKFASKMIDVSFEELCTRYLNFGLEKGAKNLEKAIKMGIGNDCETMNKVKEIKGLMDVVSGPIPTYQEVEEEANSRTPKLTNHDEIIKELKSGL